MMQGNSLSWLGWSFLSLRTKNNFNLLDFERDNDLSQEIRGIGILILIEPLLDYNDIVYLEIKSE